MNMKRYQLYLNPKGVAFIDDISEITSYKRSRILREAVDAMAGRLSNLLAAFMPPPDDYSELDKLNGIFTVKGKKKVNLSTNIDEIYYK